jgi:hypothetical protein
LLTRIIHPTDYVVRSTFDMVQNFLIHLLMCRLYSEGRRERTRPTFTCLENSLVHRQRHWVSDRTAHLGLSGSIQTFIRGSCFFPERPRPGPVHHCVYPRSEGNPRRIAGRPGLDKWNEYVLGSSGYHVLSTQIYCQHVLSTPPSLSIEKASA